MNLQLSLKKQWFQMTKSGIKTEDYREINIYWAKRLLKNIPDMLLFEKYRHHLFFYTDEECYNFLTTRKMNKFSYKDFETNTMTLGYPKSNDTERILKLEHLGIEIRTGNPDWGAEPDKLYFVVKHGSVVK
jgi:hypothetical protein